MCVCVEEKHESGTGTMSRRGSYIPQAKQLVRFLHEAEPASITLSNRNTRFAFEVFNRLTLLHKHFNLGRETFLKWVARVAELTGDHRFSSEAISVEPVHDFFLALRSKFVYEKPGFNPSGHVLINRLLGIYVTEGKLNFLVLLLFHCFFIYKLVWFV